jgi:hypothetical protein
LTNNGIVDLKKSPEKSVYLFDKNKDMKGIRDFLDRLEDYFRIMKSCEQAKMVYIGIKLKCNVNTWFQDTTSNFETFDNFRKELTNH